MLTGKYKKDEEPPGRHAVRGARAVSAGMADASTQRAQSRDRRDRAGGGGKLDISPIALALAWNLSRPGVVAPIIGPKSVKQLEDNLASLDVTLPEETVQRIDAASEPRFPYPHDFIRMMRQGMAAGLQQIATPTR